MDYPTYGRPHPVPKVKGPSDLTHDMILALVAAGMGLEEVAAFYPDIDPAQLRKLVQRALKKAPMFFDENPPDGSVP